MLNHINKINGHKVNNYDNFRSHLLSVYYQKWNSNIINNIQTIYNNIDFKDYIFELFKEHHDFQTYILKT